MLVLFAVPVFVLNSYHSVYIKHALGVLCMNILRRVAFDKYLTLTMLMVHHLENKMLLR